MSVLPGFFTGEEAQQPPTSKEATTSTLRHIPDQQACWPEPGRRAWLVEPQLGLRSLVMRIFPVVSMSWLQFLLLES
jgi:hypothetical protein